MAGMAFKRLKKGANTVKRAASDAFKKDFAKRKELRKIQSQAQFEQAKREAAKRGRLKAKQKFNPIKRKRVPLKDINKLIGG